MRSAESGIGRGMAGRGAASAAAAAIALAAGGGLASADSSSVNDAKGDSPDPFYDYVRATAGHLSARRLEHRVKTAQGITAANAGILEIDTNGKDGCEYAVAKFTYGRSVINCKTSDKEGKARIEKVAPKVMSFSFLRGVIGNPPRYRWRFLNGDDKVPNSGWKRHVLG